MRSKIIKILAVVLTIALLFGGLFLLFYDDFGKLIQQEKIKPYVPDFTLLELPESSGRPLLSREKYSRGHLLMAWRSLRRRCMTEGIPLGRR